MAIEPRAMRWRRLYEEVGRAHLLLQDVRQRLSAQTQDREQLARDLQRLTRRGTAELEALSEAYRAASMTTEPASAPSAASNVFASAPANQANAAAGTTAQCSGQRCRADT